MHSSMPKTALDLSTAELHALMRYEPRRGWKRQGLCAGRTDLLDIFYVAPYTDATPARQFCSNCPVRLDCLRVGLEDMHGIWGGSTGL